MISANLGTTRRVNYPRRYRRRKRVYAFYACTIALVIDPRFHFLRPSASIAVHISGNQRPPFFSLPACDLTLIER